MTTRSAKLPSRQVLKRLPGRVVCFLHAVGSWPALGARMAQAGFQANDHAEGTRLLAAVCAYAPPSRGGLDDDHRVARALAESEAWVGAHFRRYQMALRRLHPDEPSPFRGIENPEPEDALTALDILLQRLRQLDDTARLSGAPARSLDTCGRQREPGASAETALETLARRGLTHQERRRLELLVHVAQAAPKAHGGAAARDPRYQELLWLLEWYSDWAATAKSVILDKRQLVAMGLASPGRSTDPEE